MGKKKKPRDRRTAAERAEDEVMEFTRHKMRGNLYRRIGPPLTITNDELDRKPVARKIDKKSTPKGKPVATRKKATKRRR